MFSLVKIEWLKLKKYSAFWWMSGIVALTYPGINLLFYKIYYSFTSGKNMGGAVAKTLLGNPFAFPETWHSVAYFSSFFIFIPSILVIMIITNEYNYKTHRQNIIDGWSRDQFITSKISDIAIITSFATAVYFITALCFGLLSADSTGSFATELQYVALFFLQTFAQLSIAFFLGFVMKKAFMALGVFLFYSLIVEKILVASMNHFVDGAGSFLPFEISNKLIPPPQFLRKINSDAYDEAIHLIGQHCIYTLLLTAGIWWLCYSIYRKRDL